MDEHAGVQPGEPLPARIKSEIDASSHLVVVWSDSARRSRWVERELDYAWSAGSQPTVIPWYTVEVRADDPVADTMGIAALEPHRFEGAFASLRAALEISDDQEPELEQLSSDLAETVAMAPRVAWVVADRVSAAGNSESQLSLELEMRRTLGDPDAEAALLAKARDALDDWRDAALPVGLPGIGEPEFHLLDHAMWTAAQISVMSSRAIEPQVAPSFVGCLPTFGRVLGVTGAGFEALVAMLTYQPRVALHCLPEITKHEITPGVHGTIVDLFQCFFDAMISDQGANADLPYSSAATFVTKQRDALTPAAKHQILTWLEMGGDGPAPGGPLDLLMAFYGDSTLSGEVVDHLVRWVNRGRFDGTGVDRTDMPYMLYECVVPQLNPPDVDQVLTAASNRIRTLFRSDDVRSNLKGLQWLANADRLEPELFYFVTRGYLAGVHSVEFERTDHAGLIGGLASRLHSEASHGSISDVTKLDMQAQLRAAGLSFSIL